MGNFYQKALSFFHKIKKTTPEEMSLVGHLEELRKRLLLCIIVVAVNSSLIYFMIPQIINFLKKPAGSSLGKLVFFSPTEAIMIYFKIAFVGGVLISLPLIFYEFWVFISPGLTSRERRHTVILTFMSFIFFDLGALFSYFILLPVSLKFLLGFASSDLQPVISIGKYISFVIMLMVGCGVVFEMPILAWFLTKLGVITSAFLVKKRKYAVVANFIIAAVITPSPDIFNMCMLALPMLALYELSIWVSRVVDYFKVKKEAEVLR